jgi:deoxyribodipyrimidine photo-lyase
VQRDEVVKTALARQGIALDISFDRTLVNTRQLANKSGKPYRVFTPFYRVWRQRVAEQHNDVLPVPSMAPASKGAIESVPLRELGLTGSHPWHRKLKKYWRGGERAALAQCEEFIQEYLPQYERSRDYPAQTTSRLSAYLQVGAISPRQILAQLFTHQQIPDSDAGESFLRELAWRDFTNHVLQHFPYTTHQPMNPRFDNFKWRNDAQAKALLQAWQSGRTGIPIVDAGMRELWETGFMHNRVRMIAASLLCKNGLVDWLDGARWFWETLVDADLASNSFNWQWVAGCGADAAPYFRIFNPVTQSEKFDRQGQYLRQWLPELAGLDENSIHAPYSHQPQKKTTYPQPVIDLKQSRQRALDYFKNHLK